MTRYQINAYNSQLPKCWRCGSIIAKRVHPLMDICEGCMAEYPPVQGGQGRTEEDVKDSYAVLAMLALCGGAALVGGIVGGLVVHFLGR